MRVPGIPHLAEQGGVKRGHGCEGRRARVAAGVAFPHSDVVASLPSSSSSSSSSSRTLQDAGAAATTLAGVASVVGDTCHRRTHLPLPNPVCRGAAAQHRQVPERPLRLLLMLLKVVVAARRPW
eukprot:scaffold8018_cov350-Prasinococcus_capsulatus_cf.AAC.2